MNEIHTINWKIKDKDMYIKTTFSYKDSIPEDFEYIVELVSQKLRKLDLTEKIEELPKDYYIIK